MKAVKGGCEGQGTMKGERARSNNNNIRVHSISVGLGHFQLYIYIYKTLIFILATTGQFSPSIHFTYEKTEALRS